MGDSITHGRDSLFSYSYSPQPLNDAGPNEPGYRVRLRELLLADDRVVSITEDGEPASFSDAGVARVGRVIQGRPAFLVLLYGTNDVYVSHPIERLEANLRYIIEQCRANKIIVVICTLPPICELDASISQIHGYNAMIRSLAAGLNARWDGVLLADLDRAFRGRAPGGDVCRLLNPNGVHPTREGYLIIADTVFEELKEVAW